MARGIDHAGLQGTYREILTRDLLKPVLAPSVRLGTGKLVSVDGQNSRQIDVVIYAPEILPPFLFDETSGLFPIESALYTIEVKSTITTRGLKNAIESALISRSMRPSPAEEWTHGPDGRLNGARFSPAFPVAVLFAFGTDKKSDPRAEFDRYCSCDPDWSVTPALAAFVVVGRGYWYHRRPEDGGWAFVEATPDLDEVMAFLAGTTNTIPQLMAAKGRPRFGNFLWRGEGQSVAEPDSLAQGASLAETGAAAD